MKACLASLLHRCSGFAVYGGSETRLTVSAAVQQQAAVAFQRAMAGNEGRERGYFWHSRQRRISNIVLIIGGLGFESHPHRQNPFNWSVTKSESRDQNTAAIREFKREPSR